jgi:peptide deformylase
MSSTESSSIQDTPAPEAARDRHRELDPETRARRDAALAHVHKFGDPVLRTRARPVERFDEVLLAEVEQMGRIMDDALGIGLAATQVGRLSRLLVYRVAEDGPLVALANPEVEWASEETVVDEEGCLSLPGVLVDVERPARIRVKAQDEHGNFVMLDAEELEARVIQHEIDHLDGVLILDRTSREQRKLAMRALREAEADASRGSA